MNSDQKASDWQQSFALSSFNPHVPEEADYDLFQTTSEIDTAPAHINIIHELGADPYKSATKTFAYRVKRSDTDKILLVRSSIQAEASRTFNSAAYVATRRRRAVARIRAEVLKLQDVEEGESLSVYTSPIVEQLREVISDLQNTPEEGNTREILRCVRDSFLDGGWDKYNSELVRKTASRVLEPLEKAEEIESNLVQITRNEFANANLSVAIIPPLAYVDEEDESEAD